jgi:class 3 adenylate cyclase
MQWLKRLSIASKLIIMLLGVSGLSILLTAYLGYRSGKSNLTERVFNQLTSVRASKSYQIESYFKNIRSHIETLSETPSVIQAMEDFTRAYHQLDKVNLDPQAQAKLRQYYQKDFLPRLAKTKEGTPVLESFLPQTLASNYLQYYYIADNPNQVGKKEVLTAAKDGSDYSNVHARNHPIFRNLIQKFGYYDLFLIDPEGNIVYTVYKETDFTSNLHHGTYSDSNLARLVREVKEAKDKNYARIIDFEAYSPSYGAPAAFIAAPIFDGSRFLGVLAVQLPVDEINNVMTGNGQWTGDGLGKTGESYIVGEDYLMRSVSRFWLETPETYLKTLRSLGVSPLILERIRQYKTSILEQKVQTVGVEQALAGKQGTEIIKDYRDVPVLSSFAPLKIEGLNWVILSEMDLAEAYAPIDAVARQLLIWATLLMLLVTLLAMALAGLFVKPIKRLISMARLVKGGQLDAITPLDTEDELGELSVSFQEMVGSLRHQTYLIEAKNHENEQLLLSVFPASIAKRLQRGEKNIAESMSNISVLFADLTGFSALTETLSAYEAVSILNDIVTAFDEVSERYGIEKIKTIGDSYMAVCGLSVPYLDPDRRAVDFAKEMQSIVRRFQQERGLPLSIAIGINSGDIVAGIVGRNRFIYDVWGETINQASDLKSACLAGEILVSETVHARLQDLYEFELVVIAAENGKKSLKAWRLNSLRLEVATKS